MRRNPDSPRHRAPLRDPERRHDRARAIFGIADMMAGATAQIPPNISSQATTTQTLVITGACTMAAKLWGAGATFTDSGRGAFAGEDFALLPGDVVTYAAGGPPRADGSGAFVLGGTSGSGQGNGGNCGYGAVAGAGRTELYINGVLVLVAAGGAGLGASGSTTQRGGPGGDANGRDGEGLPSTGGRGATQSAPGAGGTGAYGGPDGLPGSGGNGGDGANAGSTSGAAGGGGGGGYRGGGGGALTFNTLAAQTGAGGSGCSYTRSGTGTLTAASYSAVGNASDPDRPANAGDNGQPGAVVLKFAPI
ncbi:hypothetical protein [Azospirillum palustre]